MRLGLGWVLVLAALSCGPAPRVNAPRRAGVDSRAFVNDAELLVRYRYTPRPHYEIELMVDLSASGGDVGKVTIEVKPTDFGVVRGPLRWSASLNDGAESSTSVILRADGETPRVTIVTLRGEEGVDLATDTIRFIVDEDVLRECQPTDSACAR